MTSAQPLLTTFDHPAPMTRPRRSGRARLAALVAAVALVGVACGGGPGSQEEFVEVLQRNGNLSETEASCIAEQVFERYGEDDDALAVLSSASDIETITTGDAAVAGFDEFYTGVVEGCIQVGPSN